MLYLWETPCFDEWDPEACDEAWEAFGKAVAHRDEVCDDDEESSS